VTKSMLNDAVDVILRGMDKLFNGLKTEMNKRFDSVESDITFIKRDIRDIKVELSDTPSRREFNGLKTRVDKYHPILKSA